MRTQGVTTSVHLDERVAGFHALGRALHGGQPVGLICTSGTAAANFLPAVAEAGMSHVPLIVMTADRPPEHLSWGVGQTFDQRGLYHGQVRAEFVMPVDGTGGSAFSHRAGWRAACTAVGKHGPVHVNWPFRLPLEPTSGPIEQPATLGPAMTGDHGPTPSDVLALRSLLAASEKPLIIAGPNTLENGADKKSLAQRIDAAAAAAGTPILADALSGLRGTGRNAVVASPSLVIRNKDEARDPDLIIHIGQTPTSKATRLWWEELDCTHVLIDPRDEWNDPSHACSHRFTSQPVSLLVDALEPASTRSDYLHSWIEAGRTADGMLADVLSTESALTEPNVAAMIGETCSAQDHIHASSSMPVRDIDTYVGHSCDARITSNRGINGIDGVVSTAAGIAKARSEQEMAGHTILLIGDVALLHDLGGVVDAARNQASLVIVCSNNDGGGIFSMLPAKEALDDDTFDALFQTRHGGTFDFLGHYPGVHHEHVGSDEALGLEAALRSAKESPREAVTILEVTTSTSERLGLDERLRAALSKL